MKPLTLMLATVAILSLPFSAVAERPDSPGNSEFGQSHKRGAPGPLIGGGVVGIIVVGMFGVGYWAVRQFRKPSDQPGP